MRKILAGDSSGVGCSAAYLDSEGKYTFAEMKSGRTHSEEYMELTDEVLRRAGSKLAEIDAFVVVHGPGSYTGTRIAVSTCKTFAYVGKKPCFAVDALQTMAYPYTAVKEAMCVSLIDARNDRAYAAAYAGDETLLAPRAEELTLFFSSLCALLRERRRPSVLLFLSPEAFPRAEELWTACAASLPEELRRASFLCRKPTALDAGRYALEHWDEQAYREACGKACPRLNPEELDTYIERLQLRRDNGFHSAMELDVLYLGVSQAERLREEKKARTAE